jgi:hypothetical protein
MRMKIVPKGDGIRKYGLNCRTKTVQKLRVKVNRHASIIPKSPSILPNCRLKKESERVHLQKRCVAPLPATCYNAPVKLKTDGYWPSPLPCPGQRVGDAK